MNTKNFICILASAALLVSCATKFPPMGKRTELAGTVIGLTETQITLRTASAGNWIIIRTDPNTTVISGTLSVGSKVTIVFYVPPGYQVSS